MSLRIGLSLPNHPGFGIQTQRCCIRIGLQKYSLNNLHHPFRRQNPVQLWRWLETLLPLRRLAEVQKIFPSYPALRAECT